MLTVITSAASVAALLVSLSVLALLWHLFIRDIDEAPQVDNGEFVLDEPPGVPETWIDLPAGGHYGVIDSTGTLRTERGTYDPLAGAMARESYDSPDPLAKVIDLHKRTAGEQ
jgi:hypothetical protein